MIVGDEIGRAHMARAVRRPRRRDDRVDTASTLEAVQRRHILRVLAETNWILAGPRGAAIRLGLKRTTLQSLMKRLGITRPRAPQADGPDAPPADSSVQTPADSVPPPSST
jgi:transcriptional regulator with GAF, ATPase, and Fis domain